MLFLLMLNKDEVMSCNPNNSVTIFIKKC